MIQQNKRLIKLHKHTSSLLENNQITTNLKYTAKSVANIASSNTLIMREYSSGDKLLKI